MIGPLAGQTGPVLLPSLPLGLSLLTFVVCAGAIWVAGIFLSNYTDVLAERLHLGSALGELERVSVVERVRSLSTSSGQLISAITE